MLTSVAASAPGKLVLSGDYAVLEGAPAISAATDLRAEVTIHATTNAYSVLHILNTDAQFRFEWLDDGCLNWLDEPGEQGTLLTAAAAVLAERGTFAGSDSSVLISSCTRSFYQLNESGTPIKKGIGSSGAIAVALTAALQTLSGEEPDVAVAMDVHSRFQQSSGSGIDVITSWYGGVVAMDKGELPRVRQLAWPAHLQVVPVWTGESASTTTMLARLADFCRRSPVEYQTVFEHLCAAAVRVRDAWSGADTAVLLRHIYQYAQALKDLDAAAGIGIWSDAHQQLEALAHEHGVVYKPSGAGGGDFGLIFATDAAAMQAAVVAAEQCGFGGQAVAWGDAGLTVSSDLHR
jgi:phosphomevalonate kinase